MNSSSAIRLGTLVSLLKTIEHMPALHTASTLSISRNLSFEELEFASVKHPLQLRSNDVFEAEAILITAVHQQEAEEILAELRNSDEPEMYLKPVFLAANHRFSKALEADVDGIANSHDLGEAAEKTRLIRRQIEALPKEIWAKNPDDRNRLKVLQFMLTRQSGLKPAADVQSKIFYRIPFIHNVLDKKSAHSALKLLEETSADGLLDGKMTDRLHLCGACGSAHLNLRATCPKCHSVDLKEEDLVHHFPCAYIGPISDFSKTGKPGSHQDGLHCPKCDKDLRHIGGDYDKPSKICHCNNCHHHFQQSSYRSLCVDCGTESDLQHLREARVMQFSLTAKGKSAALNGYLPKNEADSPAFSKQEKAVFCAFDEFKRTLKMEQSGASSGVAGLMKLEGMNWQALGDDAAGILKKEIGAVLRSYLQSADLVTLNGDSFYFLLKNCRFADANHLKEVLSFNLQKLLDANLRSQKITLKISMKPLTQEAAASSN